MKADVLFPEHQRNLTEDSTKTSRMNRQVEDSRGGARIEHPNNMPWFREVNKVPSDTTEDVKENKATPHQLVSFSFI